MNTPEPAPERALEQVPESRVLTLGRVFDAPPEKLYRAWVEPGLLMRWFCPRPWTVTFAELDMRPGGAMRVDMRGPDGEIHHHRSVFLDVVPGRRIVFTDAYTRAWEPSEKPFITATITLDGQGGGKTRYHTRVTHWTVADREAHERMGFHEGWAKVMDQLEEVARGL